MGRYIAGGATLDRRVDLLVRQLAAELSGCRWCIEHGLHRWRQAFLPIAELGALRRYAASPLFSTRERAALAFTEAVTLMAGDHVPDAAYEAVAAHYGPDEVAALLSLIIMINAWNAVGVATHAWTPGSYER